MWKKDNIHEELIEVAPGIIELRDLKTYSVPEFYFSNLSSVIIKKINSDFQGNIFNSPLGAMPYKAPAGYFDSLSDQILQKLQASSISLNEVDEELKIIAPTLIGLNKTEVYKVPTNYFENLILPKIERPLGKVVSMFNTGKVLRYFAAAVIIAFITFSAYLFFDKPINNDTAQNKIDKVENLDNVNVTAEVKTLSEEEILDFLQVYTNNGAGLINIPDVDSDFEELIKDLSEEELKTFLNQYSQGSQSTLKNS